MDVLGRFRQPSTVQFPCQGGNFVSYVFVCGPECHNASGDRSCMLVELRALRQQILLLSSSRQRLPQLLESPAAPPQAQLDQLNR